jgi:hypothetical protein
MASVGNEQAESALYLAPRGSWAGLPPEAVWWAWVGPEYASLVEGSLTSKTIRFGSGAIFTYMSDSPLHCDELNAGRTLSGAWLPSELLAGVNVEAGMARAWLDIAARHFPEALPVRFGEYDHRRIAWMRMGIILCRQLEGFATT